MDIQPITSNRNQIPIASESQFASFNPQAAHSISFSCLNKQDVPANPFKKNKCFLGSQKQSLSTTPPHSTTSAQTQGIAAATIVQETYYMRQPQSYKNISPALQSIQNDNTQSSLCINNYTDENNKNVNLQVLPSNKLQALSNNQLLSKTGSSNNLMKSFSKQRILSLITDCQSETPLAINSRGYKQGFPSQQISTTNKAVITEDEKSFQLPHSQNNNQPLALLPSLPSQKSHINIYISEDEYVYSPKHQHRQPPIHQPVSSFNQHDPQTVVTSAIQPQFNIQPQFHNSNYSSQQSEQLAQQYQNKQNQQLSSQQSQQQERQQPQAIHQQRRPVNLRQNMPFIRKASCINLHGSTNTPQQQQQIISLAIPRNFDDLNNSTLQKSFSSNSISLAQYDKKPQRTTNPIDNSLMLQQNQTDLNVSKMTSMGHIIHTSGVSGCLTLSSKNNQSQPDNSIGVKTLFQKRSPSVFPGVAENSSNKSTYPNFTQTTTTLGTMQSPQHQHIQPIWMSPRLDQFEIQQVYQQPNPQTTYQPLDNRCMQTDYTPIIPCHSIQEQKYSLNEQINMQEQYLLQRNQPNHITSSHDITSDFHRQNSSFQNYEEQLQQEQWPKQLEIEDIIGCQTAQIQSITQMSQYQQPSTNNNNYNIQQLPVFVQAESFSNLDFSMTQDTTESKALPVPGTEPIKRAKSSSFHIDKIVMQDICQPSVEIEVDTCSEEQVQKLYEIKEVIPDQPSYEDYNNFYTSHSLKSRTSAVSPVVIMKGMDEDCITLKVEDYSENVLNYGIEQLQQTVDCENKKRSKWVSCHLANGFSFTQVPSPKHIQANNSLYSDENNETSSNIGQSKQNQDRRYSSIYQENLSINNDGNNKEQQSGSTAQAKEMQMKAPFSKKKNMSVHIGHSNSSAALARTSNNYPIPSTARRESLVNTNTNTLVAWSSARTNTNAGKKQEIGSNFVSGQNARNGSQNKTGKRTDILIAKFLDSKQLSNYEQLRSQRKLSKANENENVYNKNNSFQKTLTPSASGLLRDYNKSQQLGQPCQQQQQKLDKQLRDDRQMKVQKQSEKKQITLNRQLSNLIKKTNETFYQSAR